MSSRRKKILYVFAAPASFITKDIRLLSQAFELITASFNPPHKSFTPLYLLAQLRLLPALLTCDAIVCQFAGYHSALPLTLGKWFGKPGVIIAGGTDAVSFPSIGYGNYRKKWLGAFTRWSFRMAKVISPVHASLIQYAYTYQDEDGPAQGILHHVPALRARFQVIPNGYDPTFWQASRPKKPKTFLTVAHIYKHVTLRVKGIDLLLEVAPHFPDCHFVIAGVAWEFELPDLPSNVITVGPQTPAQLRDVYSEASYYLQLSISEGFPNALCEAMLCECIPVGSAVGAIPDIVGDTGFILKKRDAGELRELLITALSANPDLGLKARQRIATNYTEKHRQTDLLGLIQSLTL
jgi:glycosyltransferase involved in cell wall biosynthesis